jgi:hypothetical protein
MTGREQDSTRGFIFPDNVGGCRSRQNRVLSNNEFLYAIGGTDFEDGLYGFGREETTITTNDQGRSLDLDGVKDGLDEVFSVVLSRMSTSMGIGGLVQLYLLLEHLHSAMQLSVGHRKVTCAIPNLFLRPDVPGFWPSNGFVAIS